jgi:hypothetical protein
MGWLTGTAVGAAGAACTTLRAQPAAASSKPLHPQDKRKKLRKFTSGLSDRGLACKQVDNDTNFSQSSRFQPTSARRLAATKMTGMIQIDVATLYFRRAFAILQGRRARV